MNEMLAPVRLLLKPRKRDVFDFNFNLHTKYTVVILLACSLLLCAQFAREPITCLPGSRLLHEKMMDAFCWVNGTFTVPRAPRDRGPVAAGGGGGGGDGAPRQYQRYYQWLSIVLLLQASLFYLPRYVWKVWQGEQLASLTAGDRSPSPPQAPWSAPPPPAAAAAAAASAKPQAEVAPLLAYFAADAHRRQAYVTKFVACELLNTANVLGQLALVNVMLDDAFLYYGYNVARYFWRARVGAAATADDDPAGVSPMDEIFPKLAKCTFYKYGPSGSVEAIDALCVLGWNIIYEKIYFLMWWWFALLIVFTCVNLLNRFVAFFSRRYRYFILKDAALFATAALVHRVVNKFDFADVFVLCKISKQMHPKLFDELLQELSNK